MGFKHIGKATERQEAPDKVTGRSIYAGDIYFPALLHGVVLRSPYAHARILKIDTAAAMAYPGVKAVLTAADLPRRRLGQCIKDQPLLAEGKVRFIGERVAAVAAEDDTIARRAAELIRVEYEPMSPVFEINEAMDIGAPLVHEDIHEYLQPKAEQKGNIYDYDRIANGDIEKGWADSDFIHEDTFLTQSVHQGYLENHAAVAMVELDGRATIWSCNKIPFLLRRQLADYIGIPENCLRIKNLPIGGEFGGKGAIMDEPLCYYLSLLTGRPVRMVMRRAEELFASNPRHQAHITIKSGVKRNGELVARQVRVIFNSGAYGGVKHASVPGGYRRIAGPYRIPHLLIEACAVYTNNNPCGQYRAPGQPQSIFAVESHMDILARELGIDPLDFRLLNVLTEGEAAPTGEKWHDLRGREVLETAARLGNWRDSRPKGMGLGIALTYRHTGEGKSGASVKVNADGSIEVLTGATDTGTGSWTILRQIVAEELGLDLSMIRIVPDDTAVAPFDSGSGASRMTHVAGRAVCNAAREVAALMRESAAGTLGCSRDNLMVGGGSFWPASRPEHRLLWREAAQAASKRGPVIGLGSYKGRCKDTVAFTAHLARVSVDQETGAVEIAKYIAVHDIGQVINPPAAEGQVEGGAMQGIGFALWEDLPKQEGRLCSTSLADYHQPTALDFSEMEVVFLEGAPGPAPYGAKAIGEIPIVPAAAAIANALEDATGVRMRDLPLIPEKVWSAINNKEHRR